MLKNKKEKFKDDLIMLAASMFLGIMVWHADIIDDFLLSIGEARLLSAFIGGLFFTSAFTTIPAVAFLAKISQFNSPFNIALMGAMGAVIADSIIFYFIRDRLVADFMETIKKPRLRRIEQLMKSKLVRLSLGIASGVLIALPIPTDETAFTLMGISRMKTYTFLLIAFSFNFGAIYVLASTVNYFSA